ncbi:MAG: HlyD family type I secretion periplasmic adaptor subunit [Rhodospirillales bacterium]|nr:HlyD family type I secretion periplasmic adaptor subunit [Rhodospirillales bacterium]
MPRSLQISPKATELTEREDAVVLPAILEFQSPSTAITGAPVPRAARGIVWIIASMFAAIMVAMALIPVDQVVTARGLVTAETKTQVIQPLDTAIVQSIDVHEGEVVQAGQLIARLNPTLATADLTSQAAQTAMLQAEVDRLQAEATGKPFPYTGIDPAMSLQAAIYAQRQSEYHFKLQNYQQKIDSLVATIARAKSDEVGYQDRLKVARDVEAMRKQLENLQVGSRLNTLAAMDNSAEMARYLANAQQTEVGATRDLSAMIAERDGYVKSWHADVLNKLSEAASKLADARGALDKARLHSQLVELRADRPSTVMSVAPVSVGSVLQSGQQLVTLVPLDAKLDVAVNIAGSDAGYVHVGDQASIKFDTFPFTRYGMAHGLVTVVSPDSFTSADQARGEFASIPLPPNTTEPYFRAHIDIGRVDLHGVPQGFHLVPGMPVTVDMKVGKRTVLGYLLERVLPVTADAMREP